MNVNKLPSEIMNMIFLYLENPESRIIKNEINIYLHDHNPYYTKKKGLYLVKSFMSFSEYYFDVRNNPYGYDSYFEKYE
jgi:hypothetical protein